jgi:hypothetical protein
LNYFVHLRRVTEGEEEEEEEEEGGGGGRGSLVLGKT